MVKKKKISLQSQAELFKLPVQSWPMVQNPKIYNLQQNKTEEENTNPHVI